MIMGGPLQLPRISSMEITIPKKTSDIPFSPFPHIEKIFKSPHRIKRREQHSLEELGNVIEEGIKEIGGKLVKEGFINKTDVNDTLKTVETVENAIVDGVTKFDHYMNSSFDKDLNDFLGFHTDTGNKETNKLKPVNSKKISVEVKRIESHVPSSLSTPSTHNEKRVIYDTNLLEKTKQESKKNEITKEIEKAVKIRTNPKKELNKEVKKLIEKEKEKENQNKNANNDNHENINKALWSRVININFFKDSLIFKICIGILAFLAILFMLCLLIPSTSETQKSMTERKFLENTTYKETNHNHLY